MHKISRIYVGNVGHNLAWYDGLLLEFTNPQDGDPTHTIFNLVNQGGKTTFLSLFFSTFDTAKDRFLQHLSNKGQRFDQYFDKGGLPGFILVEWRLPGDLASPSRTLVTGQIVVMKKAGDTFEPDRMFFWFKANPELTLERIPAPNMPGSAKHELRSRDQIMHWLHAMRNQYPGHFNYTSNQSEWRQALESEGLDMEMLRHQVDFNRKEGAMDESFLDFKTEYDFTRRFLSLAMDTRAADDVRELVASHCRRITRRKPLENSRQQLDKLRDIFAGFAQAARDYLDAEVLRSAAEEAVAVACATLEVRKREKLTVADEHTQFAEAQEKAEKRYGEEKMAYQKDAEAYHQEQLRRTAVNAQRALELAEDNVSRADKSIQLYQAAEHLDEQERRHAQVAQLSRAIEAANTDIRPFREDLGCKAALLRHALDTNRQEKDRQAETAKQAAEVANKQLGLLGVEEAELQKGKTAAERQEAQLQQRLEDAKRRRANLLQEGILTPDELPEQALERLGTEVDVLEQQIQQLEQRASSQDEEIQRQQTTQIQLTSDKTKLSASIEKQESVVSEAEHLHDRLSHDAILTRAIGAEVADPDSEVLSANLMRYMQRIQDDLTDAELVLARLEEDERSIQVTGLAGHDSDVSRIVRHLSDAGVANVSAYAEYLAEVLPQEEAARTVVLSDPGRFLGVSVPNSKQLENARVALNKPLSINKPVVVSITSDQPATQTEDRIVVAPGDGSLYNYAAAQARAGKLKERIDHARHSRDQLRHQLKAAHDAETALKHYFTQYGQGRLGMLRQALQRDQTILREKESQFVQAKQHLEQAQAEAKGAREGAKRCQARMGLLQAHLKQLQSFITDYVIHLTEWRARLAETQQAITRAISDLGGLRERKQKLEHERTERLESERVLRHQGKLLVEELERLPQDEGLLGAGEALEAGAQSLDALRSAYNTAETILKQMEAEKAGHLVIQRDEAQKAEQTAQEKFRDASEGLELAEVRAHMGVDYRLAIQQATDQRKATIKAQSSAAEAKGKASQDLEEFQRNRAFPAHTLPGIESQTDGDLAFALRDAERAARQAAEHEAEAKQQAKDAREQAKELKQASQTYANQAAPLKSLLPAEMMLPQADLTLFSTTQDIGEQCAQLSRALKDAGSRIERAHTAAHKAHEKVQRIAGEESFIKVDAELSVTLKSNPLEATIRDYARIERAITDRLETVKSELATMEQDFERATEALQELVATAVKLMRRAAEEMKLPQNVPVVGGLTVVKMARALFTLTQESRRAKLKPYMEELAADGNIPENGAALATQALLRLADNRLGIRILKMVDVADEQYVPVDGLSHSGAERISMALLLYFIIAKLRYEQRAKVRKAQGGVLMLDNPFAKATARPIWQAILSLADAMGVQLIIATGIKEYDTLSVFQRFLRLAKTERNMTTGRTHVSVADFNFHPETAKEVA